MMDEGMRKCSGGGYTGCTVCGAGPHQPCNWDYNTGRPKGYKEKNWLTESIIIPRWKLIATVILGLSFYNLLLWLI